MGNKSSKRGDDSDANRQFIIANTSGIVCSNSIPWNISGFSARRVLTPRKLNDNNRNLTFCSEQDLLDITQLYKRDFDIATGAIAEENMDVGIYDYEYQRQRKIMRMLNFPQKYPCIVGQVIHGPHKSSSPTDDTSDGSDEKSSCRVDDDLKKRLQTAVNKFQHWQTSHIDEMILYRDNVSVALTSFESRFDRYTRDSEEMNRFRDCKIHDIIDPQRYLNSDNNLLWPSSIFHINEMGKCRLSGSIFNLPIAGNEEIYAVIPPIFEKFIPLFETVLGYSGVNSSDQPSTNGLRNRDLAVIVKIQDYQFFTKEARYEGRSHAEGLAAENIIAAGIYYFDISPELSGGNLEVSTWRGRPGRCGSYYEELQGSIAVSEDTMVAFSNDVLHCVEPITVATMGDTKFETLHRKILAFFLVDSNADHITESDSHSWDGWSRLLTYKWLIDCGMEDKPQSEHTTIDIHNYLNRYQSMKHRWMIELIAGFCVDPHTNSDESVQKAYYDWLENARKMRSNCTIGPNLVPSPGMD